MIKLYFVGVIGLLVAVWFGLDWYMSNNQLSWKAIWVVWPFWILLMIVGFLLGGAVWGVIAQVAMSKESLALKKHAEANNKAYKKQLSDQQAELIRQEQTLDQRVKQAERQLDEKEQRGKDKVKALKREAREAMQEALEIKADAERLIIETKAENEIHQRSAFRATSTVKRLRRKIARLEQGTTTQGA